MYKKEWFSVKLLPHRAIKRSLCPIKYIDYQIFCRFNLLQKLQASYMGDAF